ncbi:MAG TPA: TlpA disulfide reductase family protein [Solirubrobacterales bacterium]|nr:TlpA disulfide reductase family protein [Solirubrobacterales bacterium]
MRVRHPFSRAGWALGAWLLVAAAPVPRPAPAFTFALPAGKPAPLASFQGKVVVIEFLLVRCPHCWRLAQTLDRLHRELGPRGVQAIGVAFDPDLTAKGASEFAARAAVGFPVALAAPDQVDAFLGRQAPERLQVPQLVVVDRAGVIRAQSRATHETDLEDEATLRRAIEGLLAEPARRP